MVLAQGIPQVLLHVSQWVMLEYKLATRMVEGIILKETEKAVLFKGRATVQATTRCLICGRTLDRTDSKLIGIGPDCCAKFGISRDVVITPQIAEQVRMRMARETEVEFWIPKTSLTVLRGTLAPAIPPETKAFRPQVQGTDSRPAAQPAQPAKPTFRAFVTDSNYIIVEAPQSASDDLKSAGLKFNDSAVPWKWSAPATPFMARRLRSKLKGIAGDHAFNNLLEIAFRKVNPKEAPKNSLPSAVGLKHDLWELQKRCKMLRETYPGTNYHLAMGGGKSILIVEEVAELATLNPKLRAMIACPTAVVAVWPREFAKHLAPNVRVHVVALNQTSIPARAKAARDAIAYADQNNLPLVLVMNYDTIWRAPIGPTWIKYTEKGRNGQEYDKKKIGEPGILLGLRWDLVVADEIHFISNPEAKRSEMMYLLRDHAARRRGLTGTPYKKKDLASIFGQLLFVEPGLLGTNYYAFREKWMITDEYNTIEACVDEEALHKLVNQVSIRYRLSEIRPDIADDMEIVTELYVDLPPRIMSAYKELKNQMYTEVWAADDRGIPIETNNVLTQILRLAQLAGGHAGRTETIQVGDKVKTISTAEHVHSEKEDALADWLESIGDDQPAVIFVNFQPEIKLIKSLIATKTGRIAYELSGNRNEWLDWMADQDRHVPDLWPDGKAPVIVAQIDSGAAGIDFTRCNGRFVYYVCYYSLGNKRVNYEQSRGRVKRPGTDTRPGAHIYVTHILASGTIDQDIYGALMENQEVIDFVLDKIRAERKTLKVKRVKKAA
jgi:hypothetical protein